MPEKIQRVPRGLGELLSTFGGLTPQIIQDEVHGSIELLQFYALNQLQAAFGSGLIAEGASVGATLGTGQNWTVLFGVHGTVTKTATMTACRAAIVLNRRTTFDALLVAAELGPFGATEAGNANFGLRLPYPLLCPPGTAIATRLDILGTDANATVAVFGEFGVLG